MRFHYEKELQLYSKQDDAVLCPENLDDDDDDDDDDKYSVLNASVNNSTLYFYNTG